ncbi:motility associated factor glycosyltransferase family protein [Fontivita pretiosa]|uniref:motility associated factor glycosyltransferase family protein n=1 Tax=Fontivita pretiosa TaxID=2989684 RepID=UPI003D17BA06
MTVADAANDPSLRFVLDADAPYLANLAALWAVEPRLARLIDSIDLASPSPDAAPVSYQVHASKSSVPTLVAHTADGRLIHLHSRYDPIDEAARLIDPLRTDETVAFYVQGFGLGYHVQRLFERSGDDTLLCIIEPDLRVLRLAFEHHDFSKLIESGRVLWFWELDKAGLFNRLTPWQPSITMGFQRVAHLPSTQLWTQFHEQMHTWIEEFKAYANTTVSTLVLNGRRTAENVARNLPWYIAAPSLSRLKDLYKARPAIIVSAGPSLRKNKHLLKDASDRAVIIAVQTTLQPLLELGVEPHFVTSLDYHDISTRFWEKLPENLRTQLVAEPKASSAIFDLNPGPLWLLGNDFAENLLGEMKLNKAKLPSGATVAHLAYYLAEYLGCDPIIFVGQDLGFSDGLCYTPGTSYEDVWRPELGRFCTLEMKQWEQIVRDRNILRKVPDHQGRPMYTEARLFTYLQHFERDFARSRARIIDATEGGVLKRGATPMKLSDALAGCCDSPLALSRPEYPGLNWDRLLECRQSLLNRRAEAEQIEQISRQTLPLLEEVRDHLEDQGRVNRAIGRIDVLRARMAELGMCYGLVMQLTQDSELERFKADRKIAAAKLAGIERQRRQVHRDILNVRSVIEAAARFQKLMDETMARVEQFATHPHRQAKRESREAA